MDTNGRNEQLLKCPVCGAEFPCLTAVCPGCGNMVDSVRMSRSVKAFIAEIEDYDKLIADTLRQENLKQRWMILDSFCRVLWIVLNIFTLCIPWAVYLISALRRDRKRPRLTVAEKRKESIIQNFDFPSDRRTLMEALLYVKSKVAVLTQKETNSRTVHWLLLWKTREETLYEKISGQLVRGKDIAQDAHISIAKNSRKIMGRVRRRAFAGTVIISVDLLAAVICVPMMQGGFGEDISEEVSEAENSETEGFAGDISEEIFEGEIDGYGKLTIKDMTLWFPYYWYEDGSRSEYCQFFSERNGCMARLVIGYPVDTEAEVNLETLYAENAGMLETIRMTSGFDDCKIFKYQKFKSDYGVEGILYSYTFTVMIEDMKHKGSGKYFCFPYEKDNRWFFVEIAVTDNVERENYDEEYMKTIASIRYTS